jgi:hypothetical protein
VKLKSNQKQKRKKLLLKQRKRFISLELNWTEKFATEGTKSREPKEDWSKERNPWIRRLKISNKEMKQSPESKKRYKNPLKKYRNCIRSR